MHDSSSPWYFPLEAAVQVLVETISAADTDASALPAIPSAVRNVHDEIEALWPGLESSENFAAGPSNLQEMTDQLLLTIQTSGGPDAPPDMESVKFASSVWLGHK